jgi:hypothetical protein
MATGQHGGDGDDCAASGAAAHRAGQPRGERGGQRGRGQRGGGRGGQRGQHGGRSMVAGRPWRRRELGDDGGAGKMENEMVFPSRAVKSLYLRWL